MNQPAAPANLNITFLHSLGHFQKSALVTPISHHSPGADMPARGRFAPIVLKKSAAQRFGMFQGIRRA